MMKINLCLRSIMLGLLVTSNSFAGVGSSGGGDNPADDAGAAWFARSDRIIQSCLEITSDFGVTREIAKTEIENAFGSWQEYIGRKFKFADVKLGLATRIVVNAKCSGTEDLVFYFGTMTDEVRLARAQYNNPTAFAFKRSYNADSLWGQGFIWVASQGSVFPKENFPNWAPATPVNQNGEKQAYALRAMLLHEVGHVMGNPHVSGTIMSERISEFLRTSTNMWDLTRIDQARELTVCWQCAYEWHGSLSIYGADPYANSDPARMANENFEILTGHAPKTKLVGANIHKTIHADFSSETVLDVFDSFETYSFPIQFPQDPVGAINDTRIEDSTLIFKRLLQSQPTPGYLYEKVEGSVSYGSLITSKGKKVSIILERNLPVPESSLASTIPQSPNFRADFRLKLVADGQLRPLFEGSWLSLLGVASASVPRPLPSPIPTK